MNKTDTRFTESLRLWLDDENRNYAEGAMLIYRMRANPTEYRNLSSNPDRYRDYILSTIKKLYDFRVSKITHDQVVRLVQKAEKVAENTVADGQRSGKRLDHDNLPDEIKKLYDDNILLMKKIADTHTKIRLVLQSNASCKDADLLPFAQQIVKLDKQRLANWKQYDSFA